MINGKYLLFTGILIITIAFVVTEGKKEGKGNKGRGNSSRSSNEGNNTKCMGENLPSAKLLIGFDDCQEEVVTSLLSKLPQRPGTSEDDLSKGRKKILKKSQMCIKLCQRKKQGILDASGSFSETGAENFVDDIFPQKIRPRMKRGLERCAEDNDKYEIKDSCKEYRRFEKCFMRIISKNCGWKNGKQKGNNNRRGNKARRGNKGKKHHEGADEHHDDEDLETEPLDF